MRDSVSRRTLLTGIAVFAAFRASVLFLMTAVTGGWENTVDWHYYYSFILDHPLAFVSGNYLQTTTDLFLPFPPGLVVLLNVFTRPFLLLGPSLGYRLSFTFVELLALGTLFAVVQRDASLGTLPRRASLILFSLLPCTWGTSIVLCQEDVFVCLYMAILAYLHLSDRSRYLPLLLVIGVLAVKLFTVFVLLPMAFFEGRRREGPLRRSLLGMLAVVVFYFVPFYMLNRQLPFFDLRFEQLPTYSSSVLAVPFYTLTARSLDAARPFLMLLSGLLIVSAEGAFFFLLAKFDADRNSPMNFIHALNATFLLFLSFSYLTNPEYYIWIAVPVTLSGLHMKTARKRLGFFGLAFLLCLQQLAHNALYTIHLYLFEWNLKEGLRMKVLEAIYSLPGMEALGLERIIVIELAAGFAFSLGLVCLLADGMRRERAHLSPVQKDGAALVGSNEQGGVASLLRGHCVSPRPCLPIMPGRGRPGVRLHEHCGWPQVASQREATGGMDLADFGLLDSSRKRERTRERKRLDPVHRKKKLSGSVEPPRVLRHRRKVYERTQRCPRPDGPTNGVGSTASSSLIRSPTHWATDRGASD